MTRSFDGMNVAAESSICILPNQRLVPTFWGRLTAAS
jgi:hypothetical protein